MHDPISRRAFNLHLALAPATVPRMIPDAAAGIAAASATAAELDRDPVFSAIAAFHAAGKAMDEAGKTEDEALWKARMDEWFAQAEATIKARPTTKAGALTHLLWIGKWADSFNAGRDHGQQAIFRAAALLEGRS